MAAKATRTASTTSRAASNAVRNVLVGNNGRKRRLLNGLSRRNPRLSVQPVSSLSKRALVMVTLLLISMTATVVGVKLSFTEAAKVMPTDTRPRSSANGFAGRSEIRVSFFVPFFCRKIFTLYIKFNGCF